MKVTVTMSATDFLEIQRALRERYSDKELSLTERTIAMNTYNKLEKELKRVLIKENKE